MFEFTSTDSRIECIDGYSVYDSVCQTADETDVCNVSMEQG